MTPALSTSNYRAGGTESELCARGEGLQASARKAAGLKAKEAAFNKAMQTQVFVAAVTIPHASVTKEEAAQHFEPWCHYIRCAHEMHKPEHHIEGQPDDHLHLYLQLHAVKRLKQIYDSICKTFAGRFYGSPDVRQLKTSEDRGKWSNYLKKAGDFIDIGELRIAGPAKKADEEKAKLWQEVRDICRIEGIENALDHCAAVLPGEFHKSYTQIEKSLKRFAPQPLKWDLPDNSAKKVRLLPWQKELVDKLEDPPVDRRYFWIWGGFRRGKSRLLTYLKCNYKRRLFKAEQCTNLRDLIWQYDEEGIVAWDLPKEFNWEQLTLPLCNVIEKFADFGQPLSSGKFQGKSLYSRGHCVVFANEPPPEQLRHKDVVEIHVDKYDKYKVCMKDGRMVRELMTVEEQLAALSCAESSVDIPSAPRPAAEESALAEAKDGACAEAQPPKKQRGRSKKPQPPADAVFKTRGELVTEVCEPCVELEGGEADPKGDRKKSPLQAPPEAPPEGGAAHAKDFDCSSSHGSEASTQLPESSASEATTPGEHAVNILNTEVAL